VEAQRVGEEKLYLQQRGLVNERTTRETKVRAAEDGRRLK